MSDIRSFFGVKTKNQPKSKNGPIKNRPKPLLSDSSDDDTIENTPEPHAQLKNRTTKSNGQHSKRASKRRISGSSSDDLFEATSNGTQKHTGSTNSKHTSAHATNKTSSKNGTYLNEQTSNVEKKLKPVTATDFFKSSTTNLKPIPKTTKSPPKPDNKKRKIDSDEIEEHEDPAFTAMLVDMDDKDKQKRKRSPKADTKEDTSKPPPKKAASNVGLSTVPSKEKPIAAKLSTKAKLENDTSKIDDMDDKDKQKRKRSPKADTKEDTSKPPPKKAASNVGLSTVPSKEKPIAAKLSTKAKLENDTSKIDAKKKLVANEYAPKPKKSPKKEFSMTSTNVTVDSSSTSSQSGVVSSQESNSSQKETQSQGNIANLAKNEKPSQLWVEKYKPTTTKGIIGQQSDKSNMKKLQAWLRGWEKHHGKNASGKPSSKPPPWGASKDDGAWAKAVLLSGPPGVGKTTTSYLVAKEMGYEVMETNASDTRSKKRLDTEISDALSSKSVTSNESKRLVLIPLFKSHGYNVIIPIIGTTPIRNSVSKYLLFMF